MQDHNVIRLGRIDGLRGVAALGVALAFHAQFLFADPAAAMQWAGPIGNWLAQKGWIFVDLFFLLSGYIFAHVYLPGGSLRSLDGQKQFAIARFARLYPLHLVLLVFTAAAFHAWPSNTLQAFVSHLFMLQVFSEPIGQSFVGPSWSISVEVFCYLLFALAASRSDRALNIACVVLVLAAFSLLFFDVSGTWDASGRLARGVQGFFLGVLMWKGRDLLGRFPKLVLIALMVLGFWIAPPIRNSILPFSTLVLPAALLLALRLDFFERKPLIWLGDRSYAIYLIHIPLKDVIIAMVGPFDSGNLLTVIVALAAFVALTLAASDVAYRRLEKPARTYLRSVWEKNSAPAVVTP